MSEAVVPLAEFLQEVRPGSQGDAWTWGQEAAYLWEHDRRTMRRLVVSIARIGQRKPVTVGDDGRLWDGHHRVCALMALHEPVVRRQMWNDLSDVSGLFVRPVPTEDRCCSGSTIGGWSWCPRRIPRDRLWCRKHEPTTEEVSHG